MSFGRRSLETQIQSSDASRLPPHETPFLSVVGTSKTMPTKEELVPVVRSAIPVDEVRTLTRGQLAGRILEIVREWASKTEGETDPLAERQLVTALIEDSLAAAQPAPVTPLFANVPEMTDKPGDAP